MRKVLLVGLLSLIAYASEIGKLSLVKGEVLIIRDGQSIVAKSGDIIHNHDQIKTAPLGKAQIRFQDSTIVTLGKNTNFSVSNYVYEKDNKMADLGVENGSFKVITGNIGKLAKDNFKFKANSTTIGIRGTIFAGDVGAKHQKVACLQGAITVNSAGVTKQVVAGKMVEVSGGQVGEIKALQKDSIETIAQIDSQKINEQTSNGEASDNSQAPMAQTKPASNANSENKVASSTDNGANSANSADSSASTASADNAGSASTNSSANTNTVASSTNSPANNGASTVANTSAVSTSVASTNTMGQKNTNKPNISINKEIKDGVVTFTKTTPNGTFTHSHTMGGQGINNGSNAQPSIDNAANNAQIAANNAIGKQQVVEIDQIIKENKIPLIKLEPAISSGTNTDSSSTPNVNDKNNSVFYYKGQYEAQGISTTQSITPQSLSSFAVAKVSYTQNAPTKANSLGIKFKLQNRGPFVTRKITDFSKASIDFNANKLEYSRPGSFEGTINDQTYYISSESFTSDGVINSQAYENK